METRLRKTRDPFYLLGQFIGLLIVGGGFIAAMFYITYLCITGG